MFVLMSMVSDENFAEVLERTIKPEQADLPQEAARYFLELRFGETDRARMNELASRARSGTLSAQEETELSNYMRLGWFMDLLKSKARLSLGLTPEAV
jgi:hypothetical protein